MIEDITLAEYKLSEDLKKVFYIAQRFAVENLNSTFSSPHILKALLHKDVPTRAYMNSAGKDIYYLEEWADIRIEELPKTSGFAQTIHPDDKVIATLEEADILRVELNRTEIDSFCLLAAVTIPGLAFSYDQLRTLPINKEEIMSSLKGNTKTVSQSNTSSVGGNKSTTVGSSLHYVNLNVKSIEQNQQETIGREKELRMILEILCRKSKPNVIVIGDPGVGKTTVIEGLAWQFANGKVPSNLAKATVFELDLNSLQAGTSYKGEVEDRLKTVIQQIKEYEKPILFIDEFHILIDKNKGLNGLVNLLKPELTKGELTIIGATTTDDYRKHLESDDSLIRRFESVTVNEPDLNAAVKMIKKVVMEYEKHHNLKLEDDAIEEAVRLSKRYIKERRLPDSAIDLLDRTMAGIRIMKDTSAHILTGLSSKVSEINSETLKEEEISEDIVSLYLEIKNEVSYLLLNKLEEVRELESFKNNSELYIYIQDVLNQLQTKFETIDDEITKADLAAVIADKTGIPIGKVQSQERDRLLNMEQHLRKRVVGQDYALKSITEAVLESRSGLNKGNQPIGAFFLLGPTGTGKTELAKALCEFLFQDDTAMIRFDMSEFKEEHSAALLYGAPPGYVGYEEGGLLVNKIRQHPYSVVLFDEIEKAHPSVFDIFLQIMDEGKLHDRLGKEGDFSNAVILFTSNIGSDFIVEKFNSGSLPKSNDLMEIMTRFFRPEFLARLTEIVPFAPISENVVLDIFNIHLKGLLDTLEKKGIEVVIEDRAKKHLALLGYTPKYGARPLKGIIRDKVRRPLSRMIISEEIKRGNKVVLRLAGEDSLEWDIINFE